MLHSVKLEVNERENREADRASEFHRADSTAEVDGGNAGGTE